MLFHNFMTHFLTLRSDTAFHDKIKELTSKNQPNWESYDHKTENPPLQHFLAQNNRPEIVCSIAF